MICIVTRYYLDNKIKDVMSTQMCPHLEEKRNEYRVLMEKSARRRPLGKSKCKWEDNIKMDLT
jgi:hypothetical protein